MDTSLLKNAILTKGKLFINIILLCHFTRISNSDIRTYYMNDYCHARLNLVSEKIFQFKLIPYPVDIYSFEQRYCEIKIETWYNTYNKLMFYFEELNLDCRVGHLEFFDDQGREKRIIGLEKDVCGTVMPKGDFTVDTRFLKIIYISTGSEISSSVFSIIITAFRDDTCPNYAHKCDNSRCIDKDLACNGFNSCGDNSSCSLSTSTIIGIAIGCIVGLLFIVALMVFCIYRRRRRRGDLSNMIFVLSNNETAVDDNGITLTSYSNQSYRHINQVTAVEGNTDSHQNQEHYRQYIVIENDNRAPPSYTALFGNNPRPMLETNEANSDSSNFNSQHTLDSRRQNVYSNTDDAALPSYSDLFASNNNNK